jgi:hypothetical protein
MSKQQSNQTSNEFTESVCLNDRHLWSVNQTVHHSLFSVSLVIRVAIQSQGFFVFSPPFLMLLASHPGGQQPRKHSIQSKLCLRCKKLSRWTTTRKITNEKNPWPKTGTQAINPGGWKQHVAFSDADWESPACQRKKKSERHPDNHSRIMCLISCFWFRCCSWFTRFNKYGYLVQFLPIPLAMRRNPLHTHIYILIQNM